MPIISTSKTLAQRDPFDHYPTPINHVRAGLATLPAAFQPTYILDPGAGEGAWGIEARRVYPDSYIVGTDIRPLSRPRAYDYWLTGGYDYLLNRERAIFDLVIGNPPFGKRGTQKDRLAAEKFVRRSLALLIPGGWLVFMLPLTFLAGQRRARGLYRDHQPVIVYICAERPSFTGNGKTDNTEYAIYCWQAGYTGDTQLRWLIPSDYADSSQLRLMGGF